ncbi:MAG TPA: hypothetical protein VFE61_00295, partial [Candidatus Sulfotelmatobacter sp.]|nr:hypothetical protein [Candidatus Sulfotelmatobacter sp.]
QSPTQDLSDQDHEQLKEAYELTVSTLFGETAMTFVPLPGSLEIVSVAFATVSFPSRKRR